MPLAIAVCAGASGVLVAYLSATGGEGGPIYSGWMTLFTLGAAACCGLGVLGGVLALSAPGRAVLVLATAAGAYVGIIWLMLRRYRPDPAVSAVLAAAPVALLFAAAAGLALWRWRRPDFGA